eukprot:c18422_g1_i1 orf=182-472(+)
MGSSPSTSLPHPNHSDATPDLEDDNVKQLKECGQLYLDLQECLIRTDRNWTACQKGTSSETSAKSWVSEIFDLEVVSVFRYKLGKSIESMPRRNGG